MGSYWLIKTKVEGYSGLSHGQIQVLKQFFMKLPLCALTQPSSMLAPFSGKIPHYSVKTEARSSRPFFYPLNNPLRKVSLFPTISKN